MKRLYRSLPKGVGFGKLTYQANQYHNNIDLQILPYPMSKKIRYCVTKEMIRKCFLKPTLF